MLRCVCGSGKAGLLEEKTLGCLFWINHLIPPPQGQQSIGYCRSLHKNSPLSPTAVECHIYVIPAFTWILTLAILLAHTVIQPITSLLTLLKGILLIVT
ncbi:uncharacterized protein AKAME5_001683000, partial [Lates japonicus]